MEFIILGLLLIKPMTGYEIGRFIKTNLSMICSDSAGSLQTAIKKLISDEKITFSEFVENGKNKKQFSITLVGKTEFSRWVQKPMQIEKVKNMELSKLFFLGFAEKEQRVAAISSYINQLEEAKSSLLAIKKSFEQMELKPDSLHEIFCYQYYTLEYGIDSVVFEIGWYKKLLSKMENQK